MKIALVAPPPDWSIYYGMRALSRRLKDLGHDVDMHRSRRLPFEDLDGYDRIYTHFQDFQGFRTKAWEEIKDHTWVNAGGYNYVHVPWENIENVIARSKFMQELLPVDSVVCPPPVDTDLFYPDDNIERKYDVGTVGNRSQPAESFSQVEELCEGRYSYHHHDGWNTEHVDNDRMGEIYNQFEVFVCLSDFEGGGMTVLEAAGCGCGIVSTPTGNAPDIEGVVLVPENPSNDEVITAIEEARGRDLSNEIRENWSWEVQIDRWIDALEL